jgi:hypothetical protein
VVNLSTPLRSEPRASAPEPPVALPFPAAVPAAFHQTLLLLLLFAVALAIRLPNLLLIPRFEDESQEVAWALEIARGLRTPLTGIDAYYGPLFFYLVAGLFWVFGENMLWPRLLVAVTGALTVPAIYLLGSAVANQRAGLVAACVALANVALVLFASHTGWSASLGPPVATVTLLATYVGVTGRKPYFVALGGVCGGLLMQIHPLNAVLLIGLACWYLFEVPVAGWLRRVDPIAALGGVVVGYSPMLWMWATRTQEVMSRVNDQTYAYAPSLSPLDYGSRLGVLGLGLALLGLAAPLLFLLVALPTSLLRKGNFSRIGDLARLKRFLLCSAIVPLMLLPLVITRFLIRYLGWLQPIMCVAVGAGVVALWPSRVIGAGAPHRVPGWVVVTALLVGADLAALAVVAISLTHVGGTNAKFFELRDYLRSRGGCANGMSVEDMDAAPISDRDKSWVFFNQQAIVYTLEMERCPVKVMKRADLLTSARNHRLNGWLVISEGTAAALAPVQSLRREIAVDPAATGGARVAPEFRFVLLDAGQTAPSVPAR